MFDFFAVWGPQQVLIAPSFIELPFISNVFLFVGNATEVEILLKSTPKKLDKAVKVLKVEPFTVNNFELVLKQVMDSSILSTGVKLAETAIKLQYMVFEFTPDNRLVVHGTESYTGKKEFPAYISFKNNILVGAAARSMQQRYPKMVVYDIPRLLTPNFKPNPKWAFKTTRTDDGKVRINMGESCSTIPEVCLGIAVKALLLYVQQYCEIPIKRVGVKLPKDAAVNKEMSNAISARVGVKFDFVSCY
uniref:Ald_Xan_dh_C2 domain-containing protein n=1 Tax=Panagrellus redivivus TaxID=6233 RepID=A0A7E4W3U9_PANRE